MIIDNNSNSSKISSVSDVTESNGHHVRKESISLPSPSSLLSSPSSNLSLKKNSGGQDQQGIEECSTEKQSFTKSETLLSLDRAKSTSTVSKFEKPLASMKNDHSSKTGISTSTGCTSNPNGTKSKGGTGNVRRRGKWTVEEEEYVARVIRDFNSGFLNAPAGYTLRSFLSDKLQCDPMRITKKFTGEACIGKRVFHPAVRNASNSPAIDKAQSELDALEKRWRQRLEAQQRESAKKAAASAAAATAASRGNVTVQGVQVAMLGTGSLPDSRLQQTAVTQAASWLDRANVILMGNIDSNDKGNDSSCSRNSSNDCFQQKDVNECRSIAEESLENQIKDVQRLMNEGNVIPNLLRQTTATATATATSTTGIDNDVNTQIQKFDTILSANITSNTRIASIPSTSTSSLSSHEPADKRMRVDDLSGTEDAEALVGFLRSVRASAAAAQEL